jgi:hypothetical protein
VTARKGQPDPAAELRELVREAHGAIRDLDRLLADYRRILREGAEEARQAAFKAADAEIARFGSHLEDEARRVGETIQQSIGRARAHIMEHLMISTLETMPDGRIKISFATGGDDDDERVAEVRARRPATGRDLALLLRAGAAPDHDRDPPA